MHSETWGPRESKQDPVSILSATSLSGGLSAMMQLYLFPSAEGVLRRGVGVCVRMCMRVCMCVHASVCVRMCVCENLLGHGGGRQKNRYLFLPSADPGESALAGCLFENMAAVELASRSVTKRSREP